MKKTLFFVLMGAMLLILSSCSEGSSAHTNETTSSTEAAEKPYNATPFIHFDLTGAEAETDDLSSYTLKYALGWKPFDKELTRIDDFSVINGLMVTYCYSEYNVSTFSDGSYTVNCCKSGYSLYNAGDYFGGIEVEGIAQKRDGITVINIIKKEADQYFYDVSACTDTRKALLEEKTIMTLDGIEYSVQPQEIILRNAEDFPEISAIGEEPTLVSLTLENISFTAYAQDAADSSASVSVAEAFVSAT